MFVPRGQAQLTQSANGEVLSHDRVGSTMRRAPKSTVREPLDCSTNLTSTDCDGQNYKQSSTATTSDYHVQSPPCWAGRVLLGVPAAMVRSSAPLLRGRDPSPRPVDRRFSVPGIDAIEEMVRYADGRSRKESSS